MLNINPRLASEFLTCLRNNKFEVDEAGAVRLAKSRTRIRAHGAYTHWVNDAATPREAVRIDCNLLPPEGLAYLLETGFRSGTANTHWYLALYSNSTPPAGTWTASNFVSNASEITSQTEGYSGAQRKVWLPDASTTDALTVLASMENATTVAEFNVVTASSLSVRGAALLSRDTRGSTLGVLASATTYSAARTLYNGDTYRLIYTVELTSSDD